jgi:hypothetical protein
MPPSENPFPTSTRSQIWTYLCDVLENDPTLKSAVNLFQLWQGRDEDLAEPCDEDCPVLRMTPVSSPGQWLDESTHSYRWTLKIDLGVIGTDVRTVMDFWAAVESALFTGNTVLDALVPYGLIQKTLSAAAFEPHLFGDAAGIRSTGSLTLHIRVDS